MSQQQAIEKVLALTFPLQSTEESWSHIKYVLLVILRLRLPRDIIHNTFSHSDSIVIEEIEQVHGGTTNLRKLFSLR